MQTSTAWKVCFVEKEIKLSSWYLHFQFSEAVFFMQDVQLKPKEGNMHDSRCNLDYKRFLPEKCANNILPSRVHH